MPSFAPDPFVYLRQRAIRGGGSGGAVVAPVLGPLTLSPNTASLNSPYSGTVTGKSAGSTLSLSGPGAVGLSVVGAAAGGTPTVLGVVNIIETLAGADNSPRTSSGVLTVADAPAVAYLPSSPAPQLAYSNEKLWSDYSGPAMRSVRPSDSAIMDFPFLADGSLDMSGYSAFAGASDLTVSEWKDQAFAVNGGGANSNNAIQTTAANRPRLRSGNAMRGKQPISTGMQIDGRIANDRCLALPAIANTRRSVTRMWVGSLVGGTFNSIGIWGLGVSGGAADNLSLIYDTTNGKAAFYTLDSNFNSGIGGPPTAELAIFTYVSGPTSRSLYINGQLVNTIASPATDIALTGGWVGRGSWSAATNGPAEFAADIVWSTPLSDSDRIAFETVLAARFGITYTAYSNLIAYNGHSIIAGMNESGYFQNLPRLINNAWTGTLPKTPNFGVAGQTALEIFNRRAATATAASAAGFAKKAHVICMATNSVENLASGSIVGGGATIYSTYILPYIQYMQTTGGFESGVVYVTDPPRGWTGSATDIGQKEAEMQSIISLLKTDASGQGFTVVDWHNAPEMTTGIPSGGNPLPPNPVYYGSGTVVHPNPAGYEVCKNLLMPVLQGLLA